MIAHLFKDNQENSELISLLSPNYREPVIWPFLNFRFFENTNNGR